MNARITPPGNPPERITPHPRDWRYWVGGAGRILLIIGVLTFGFLVYQLWGTGIEYHQHQNALAKEFNHRKAELAVPTTSTVPSTSPPTPIDTAATVTGPTGATGASGATSPADSIEPAGTSTTTTVVTPGGVGWPALTRGDVLAVVEIPKIHKRVYAVAGVRTNDLKRGLGHYPNTSLPGQYGNSAFAGHRTTFGAPLFDIDKLSPGDEIVVSTVTNERYVYIVSAPPRVVSRFDVSVISTTSKLVAMLTLTSCHPKYSAEQRIVVTAVLDASQSGTVHPATPEADSPSADDVGSDVVGDTVEASPGDSTADTTADSTVDSATDSTVVAELPSDTGADSPTGPSDLSHGWFEDPAAWWHVAGWGLLDAVIVAAGWLLARRTKRWWLGVAVAALPFLFVLYFVYQNINRLLPADL